MLRHACQMKGACISWECYTQSNTSINGANIRHVEKF
jgi:hypothetical protein